MKIATASLNQTPLDWQHNRNNIVAAISKAKNEEVDLLCLPEMCIPGYGCEDMFLHPWVAKKSLKQLQEILPETIGIAVIVGLPYWYLEKLFNVICLISNGAIQGFQAKQNLPFDGVHYEPRWFSEWQPGRLESVIIDNEEFPFGDNTYHIMGKKLGFEICEDAWVLGRPAGKLVEQAVDIILNPSASHFALMKSKDRENRVISASKEFNCAYVFANQLGNEAGKIIYEGDAIIAFHGEIAASTPLFSFKSFEMCICDIDFEKNLINDINLAAHHESKEEQFVSALSLALFDYLRKSKSNGFTLSLSGGADSSTCLILLAESIKRANNSLGTKEFLNAIGIKSIANNLESVNKIINQLITTVYQASENSSEQTYEAAHDLANSIGARFYRWSIDDGIRHAQEIIENIVERNLTWQEDDIVLQNIQARSRSPIIWMLANLQNNLLITTSNRSEGGVGYATMDGDTSGSIAPIAGIDKPFIIQWLKWAQINLDYPALDKVIRLAPSAELRPKKYSQTDEEDLMPYEILNKIEGLFIGKKLSPFDIYREISEITPSHKAKEFVIKFFELWSKNQWKRERLAPSFHIDDYNIDPRSGFRFPILSSGFENELDELRKLNR